MRCFISINFPENIREEIKSIQETLPEFKGKKTETNNLHLTLKFLGEIDEEKIELIKRKLREVKFKKFKGGLGELGFFSEKFIRIIWMHITGVEELQREIDKALSDLLDKEKRFMSHVTIARVKNVKDRKRFIEELRRIKVIWKEFLIDRFYLMKSELKEEGPEYFVIEEYNLD